MDYRPIIVLGCHRSGTSITTKILQDMIGEFPFKVTRHYEPVELVDIHTRFLERHKKVFLDRLYFPTLKPDLELFTDYVNFLWKYKNERCLIKEPVLSITSNWFPFAQLFQIFQVEREKIEVMESLMHHKKLSQDKAEKIIDWYETNLWQAMTRDEMPKYWFSADKKQFKDQLYQAAKWLKITWNDEVFEKEWDAKQIQPYKTR